jgi:hypothetical protein
VNLSIIKIYQFDIIEALKTTPISGYPTSSNEAVLFVSIHTIGESYQWLRQVPLEIDYHWQL